MCNTRLLDYYGTVCACVCVFPSSLLCSKTERTTQNVFFLFHVVVGMNVESKEHHVTLQSIEDPERSIEHGSMNRLNGRAECDLYSTGQAVDVRWGQDLRTAEAPGHVGPRPDTVEVGLIGRIIDKVNERNPPPSAPSIHLSPMKNYHLTLSNSFFFRVPLLFSPPPSTCSADGNVHRPVSARTDGNKQKRE